MVAIIALFFLWKDVLAPTIEKQNIKADTNKEPAPSTGTTPAQSQPPAQTPTTGTLTGRADSSTLHINKIIVYDSSGKNIIATVSVASDGSFIQTLAPGDYMIDYAASPDPYPHAPEKFTITPGQTHEVDYLVEK